MLNLSGVSKQFTSSRDVDLTPQPPCRPTARSPSSTNRWNKSHPASVDRRGLLRSRGRCTYLNSPSVGPEDVARREDISYSFTGTSSDRRLRGRRAETDEPQTTCAPGQSRCRPDTRNHCLSRPLCHSKGHPRKGTAVVGPFINLCRNNSEHSTKRREGTSGRGGGVGVPVETRSTVGVWTNFTGVSLGRPATPATQTSPRRMTTRPTTSLFLPAVGTRSSSSLPPVTPTPRTPENVQGPRRLVR